MVCFVFETRKRVYAHCLSRNFTTCAALAATSFHDHEQLSFRKSIPTNLNIEFFVWRWEVSLSLGHIYSSDDFKSNICIAMATNKMANENDYIVLRKVVLYSRLQMHRSQRKNLRPLLPPEFSANNTYSKSLASFFFFFFFLPQKVVNEPFMRVPIGSPALFTSTHALSSNFTRLPSGR